MMENAATKRIVTTIRLSQAPGKYPYYLTTLIQNGN